MSELPNWEPSVSPEELIKLNEWANKDDIGKLFMTMNSIFFDYEPEDARKIIQMCADAAWKDFIKYAKRENSDE